MGFFLIDCCNEWTEAKRAEGLIALLNVGAMPLCVKRQYHGSLYLAQGGSKRS